MNELTRPDLADQEYLADLTGPVDLIRLICYCRDEMGTRF